MSIKISNLTKTYKVKGREITALNNISLSIKEGEFLGLLGPNGAGKTTLTKILATLVSPDQGTAFINNINIKNSKKIRQLIGPLFGENGGRSLYYRLSIYDNLIFYSSLAGVPKKIAKKRINLLLDYFELDKYRDVLVMKLSTGMKTKVLFIRTLIPNPKILLLDEPTLGFDANTADKARNILEYFNKKFKTTIILTSHNFQEVDSLTERIVLIDKGKIIKDCAPESFKQLASKNFIDIHFSIKKFNKEIFSALISQVIGGQLVEIKRKEIAKNANIFNARIVAKKFPINETIALLNNMIVERGGKVFQLQPYQPSLKEAFLAYLNSSEKKYEENIEQKIKIRNR
ncbi:MAG: ABC transporter ATP-binding protein [Candidatus Heimdallarchaeaceae archaeon]